MDRAEPDTLALMVDGMVRDRPWHRAFHVSQVHQDFDRPLDLVWWVTCRAPKLSYTHAFRLEVTSGHGIGMPCRVPWVELMQMPNGAKLEDYVADLTSHAIDRCRRHLKRYMRTLKHGYRTLPHQLDGAQSEGVK